MSTPHDEFDGKITPAVESGLIRMEYYGDGIVPLLADLEYTKEQKETRTDPGYPAQVSVVALWHRGTDILTIVDPDMIEEIEIQALESGYGGDADEGDDWGDRERDRRAEEALGNEE